MAKTIGPRKGEDARQRVQLRQKETNWDRAVEEEGKVLLLSHTLSRKVAAWDTLSYSCI